MFTTKTRRVLVALAVALLIACVMGVMALADDVTITVERGDKASSTYNPDAPELGGWVIDSESGKQHLYYAEKAMGFYDDNARFKNFDRDTVVTYILAEDEQFYIKDMGKVTYYRRASNGGAFLNNYGAEYELILETVDGQKAVVREQWYKGSNTEAHTAWVTDISAAVAALDGNPLLKSISIRPFASEDAKLYEREGTHLNGVEYQVVEKVQATDADGNPLFEEDGKTPVYVQAKDEAGNLLFAEDGTTPIWETKTVTKVSTGTQIYFLFRNFTFSEIAAAPTEETFTTERDNFNGTTVTAHDGKIMGLDADKTYAYGGIYSHESDLITVSGVTEITGLAGGVYEIRGVEEGKPNSAPVYVTVHKVHYTNTLVSVDGAKNEWAIVDDTASGVNNTGKAVQSQKPISGYWTSPVSDPYDVNGGITLATSSQPRRLRGEYDPEVATYNMATNENAGLWWRRNMQKFVYVFTPEEQFYPKDQKMYVSAFHGGTAEFANGVKNIQYAVVLYTDTVDAEPFIVTGSYSAASAYQELEFTIAGLPEDALITRMEVFHYWNVPAVADEELVSADSTYPRLRAVKASYTPRPENPVVEIVGGEAEGEFKAIGLDPYITHQISTDGKTWTQIGNEITGLKAGETVYLRAVSIEGFYSQDVAVTVPADAKAQPAATAIAGEGKIEGLNAALAYEYATFDIFGFGEWKAIEAGATEIAVDTGLYAVRVKAADGVLAGAEAFVLVGEAKLNAIFKNDDGKFDANTTVTDGNKVGPFDGLGIWSSDRTYKVLKDGTNDKSRAILMVNGDFYPSTTSDAYIFAQTYNFNYATTPAEMVSIDTIGRINLNFTAGGNMGVMLWEGKTQADFIATIRFYVAGSDVAYYEIPFNWVNGNAKNVYPALSLPADAHGYVTAISIRPYGGTPEGWEVQDNYRDNDPTVLWGGRLNYGYCSLYFMDSVVPADAPVISISAANGGGYELSGFEAGKTYAISTDGKNYTTLDAGTVSYVVKNEGTYYVRTLGTTTAGLSEIATVVIDGAQADTKDLVVDGNKITGLKADYTYEYAPVNIFGYGEWTDVDAGATEITVDTGLWAVRIKASNTLVAGAPAYVLVGETSMEPFYVGEDGIKGANSTVTDGTSVKGWEIGMWTSDYSLVKDDTHTKNYAYLRTNFGAPSTDEAAYNMAAKFGWKYAAPADEIIPVGKLGSIKYEYYHNGYIGWKLWEDKDFNDYISAVRVYVAGADVEYYEFIIPWNGSDIFTINFQDYLPADAEGYVTGISILPHGGTPEGWHAQDGYDSEGVAWKGRDVYLYIRLHSYSELTVPEAPVLAVNANTKGTYTVSGFDSTLTYAVSTNGIDYTNIGTGFTAYDVENVGTYYFKVAKSSATFESAATVVAINGKQATVSGLKVEDGKITGLVATETYEYTNYNMNGFGEWTTVTGVTELEVDPALWAIRLPAGNGYVSGEPTFVQIKGENYGSIAYAVTSAPGKYVPGSWTSSGDSSAGVATIKNGSVLTWRVAGSWTPNYENRQNFWFAYSMADGEIVPAQDLSAIRLTVANGVRWPFDGAAQGKVRFHIAGGNADYYDVDYMFYGSHTFFADINDVLPEDENGYVVGFVVYYAWEVPSQTLTSTAWGAPVISMIDIWEAEGWTSTGDATKDRMAQDRWRVSVVENEELKSLEFAERENAYIAGTKVILDPTKSYEISSSAYDFTALPAGTSEYVIPAGHPTYIRYAATEDAPVSAPVKLVGEWVNPVFSVRTLTQYSSIPEGINGATNNVGYAGIWNNYNDRWGSQANVCSQITSAIKLSDVAYRYTFADNEKFVINDHPYFSTDFNDELNNMGNIGYIEGAIAKYEIWVEGEDDPYVITSEWKGKAKVGAYTPNKVLVNLLDMYPELDGKTVIGFTIRPYSNIEKTPADFDPENTANHYIYYRLYYIGFFDAADNTIAAASNTNQSVTTVAGIEATSNVFYSIGAEFNPADVAVYEVYENGNRWKIENFNYTLPEDFAEEAGLYTVEIEWNGNTATVEIRTGLESIAIKSYPKTEYFDGDKLDLKGLQLIAILGDGTEIDVTEGYTADVDTVTLDTTTVTLTFGGKTVSFDITVNPVILEKIEIATLPDKEVNGGYTEGEAVDLTGLTVNAVYNNGAVEILTLDQIEAVYGADVMTRGTTLTITYDKFTLNVILTVNSKAIAEVSIATPAEKTQYMAGEELDITGLSVNVLYEDGTSAIITEGFITSADLSVYGDVEVSVIYEGFTLTYTVNVIAIETAFIMEFPAKLEYQVGEELDIEGLILYVLYSDGEEALLTEGFELIYDEFTAEGEYEVVLKYYDYEEPFVVTVVAEEEPEPDPVVVESITVTAPTKTEYTVGDTLDLAGMVVTANLSDGTTENVTAAATVDTTTLATAGNVTVTVTYEGFTATFVVTVAEKVVEPENIAEGTIGTVNWVITTDGTLTVSGEGEVPNYTRSATAPWYAYTKQIKKIVVADGITKLGDYCFYNLSKATAIEISTTVKFLGVQFIRQTAITEVTLTSDVTITANAFGRADNLKTLNLSEDVKNLQGNIFYQETVTIKAPENSFAHKYAEIYASKFASSAATVAYESDGTTAKLPIVRFAAAGDNAFFAIYENAKGNWALEVSGIGVMKNFPYVSAKNIAKGFTFSPMYYIGDEEAKIDGVEPEAKIASITVKEGITTVGNYIFYKCTKATTLTLPEGITSIGQGAFRLCQRIAKITLPEAVTKIEKNAFLSCGKLVEIYIPEGVTTVGEGIFEKCDSINSLVVKTKSAAAIEVISAEYPMVTIVTEF